MIKLKKHTHYVEVRGIGCSRISPDPWWTATHHVYDCGSQTIDVSLCVVPSTQNQLWTHIHLYRREKHKI